MTLMNDGIDLGSILIMLSVMPVKVQPLLDIWLRDESLASVQYFIEFAGWIDFQNDMKFTNAFADEDLQSVIRIWLSDKPVMATFMQRIENFIFHPEGLSEEVLTSLNMDYEILSMKN